MQCIGQAFVSAIAYLSMFCLLWTLGEKKILPPKRNWIPFCWLHFQTCCAHMLRKSNSGESLAYQLQSCTKCSGRAGGRCETVGRMQHSSGKSYFSACLGVLKDFSVMFVSTLLRCFSYNSFTLYSDKMNVDVRWFGLWKNQTFEKKKFAFILRYIFLWIGDFDILESLSRDKT